MKMKSLVTIIGILTLSLFLAAGCASKKKTQDATKVTVMDDSRWKTPEPIKKTPAKPKIDEKALAAAAKAKAMEVLGFTINFEFDSYELSADARATLAEKADILKKYPDLKVVIEGYCDNRGTEEYNLALGERRARAAYEHLVILGIDPGRLSIISFGEERPIDPANNEEAWAKNRRDEFKISY